MATEFVMQSKELTQALKFVLPSTVRVQKAQAEFIAINASNDEVEFASTNRSSSIPAEVIFPGNAGAPVWVFEWFRKAVKTLKVPSVHVSIVDGQMKVGGLTYSYPEIVSSDYPATIAASTDTRDEP